MTVIADKALIERSKNHLDTDLDGEVIIMAIDSGQVYGVAETGKVIWDALSGPVRFGDVVDQLLGEFDVDRPTCQAEASQFLTALAAQKFITVTDG